MTANVLRLRADQPEPTGRRFDLAALIVDTDYSYAGVLSRPDDLDEEGLAVLVDDVMGAIAALDMVDALRQALRLCVPGVLRAAHPDTT